MRILVCVKQVPDGAGANPGRSVNLADKGALEAALCLRGPEDSVTLLSLGRPEAVGMLLELLQTGADAAVLVTDTAAAGSDTLATARIIAAAAERLGGFDLILTGRRAADAETGHIGPETAVLLGVCCVPDAVSLSVKGEKVACGRLLEESVISLEVPLPAVVTVSGGYILRPPSIAAMRKAREKKVERLTLRDIGLPPELAGIKGSATAVSRVWQNVPETGRCVMYRDLEEGAEAVLELLRHPPEAQKRRAQSPKPPAEGRALVAYPESDAASVACVPELTAAARACFRDVSCVPLGGGPEDETVPAGALAEYIRDVRPALVLFPATLRCRAIAPMCAAMLGIGLSADCTGVEPDGKGGCILTRPTFGGELTAEIVCLTSPAMATVRPGAFDPDGSPTRTAALCSVTVPRGTVTGVAPSCAPKLSGELIVSGGKGLGGRDGFRRAEELAALLGASLGASRGAVDAGYISYPHQVGQTGATVRPRVYLALGISGAVQHMAGVRAAAVAAVNTDPKAPVFGRAAVGVIGDCAEFMDILVKKIRTGDMI